VGVQTHAWLATVGENAERLPLRIMNILFDRERKLMENNYGSRLDEILFFRIIVSFGFKRPSAKICLETFLPVLQKRWKYLTCS